jgi:STE24 endopeptidase
VTQLAGSRAFAWLSLGLGVVSLGALLVWSVPWQMIPDPVPAESVFSAQELDRAEAFQMVNRWLAIASLGVSLCLVAWFGLRPPGFLRRLSGSTGWQILFTVLVVRICVFTAVLPIRVMRHHRALDYGLTNQTWASWLFDISKAEGVNVVTLLATALILVFAAKARPRVWPLITGAVLAGGVVMISWLFPLIVEPLFSRFTPLPDTPLRAEISALAQSQNLEVQEILVADASRRTTAYNAYVSGFGHTRRIVLYDTLLADRPREEVLMVVAHELAHARDNDVIIGTALGASAVMLGVGLLGILPGWERLPAYAQVTTLIAALTWSSFLTAPVTNAVSRQLELRADQTALNSYPAPDVFGGLQRSLALGSLADPTPPLLWQWWWGSHPTVVERIGLITEDTR